MELNNTTNKRIGEIKYNKKGQKMEIVECIPNDRVIVKFEDGCKKNIDYLHFKMGHVFHPYDKTILGIGCLGEGKYLPGINGKGTKHYISWHDMLRRCYDPKYQERQPTYKGCTVCEKWLNFQNYSQWYYENYYEIEGQRMHLDKDILNSNNKVYSPEFCVFVPQHINELFTKCDTVRGDLPIGVGFNKREKVYMARGSNGYSKVITLGSFSNPIDAFNVYKIHKEQVVKNIADEYKDRIPQKLYEAMYRYEVKIID